MARWLPFLLACAALAAPAPARDSSTSSDRVLHITIEGDLDSSKLAADFADLLSGPEPTRAVILETGANGWRRDVLWHIADAASQSQARLIVLLSDGDDGRVGMGALLLALLADAAAIGPRTSLGVEPTDDASDLAPPRTDAERIDRELGGLIWVALKRRGLDPAMGESLLRCSSNLWVSRNPAGLPEIVAEPPTSGGHRLLEVRADGSARGSLDRVDLLTLGLIDAEAADARALARDEGLAGLERVRLRNEVSPTREEILTAIGQVDEQIADVKARLNEVRYPPDDRVVPPSAYRRAGREASMRLREIAGYLARTEHLFDEHPELLHTPAPEGTPVGRTPERNVSDWRAVFLNRRRDLEALEERARDYARR